MNNINKKIGEIRKRRGQTLEQLAGLTGLTKGYLSKIECGKKAPPVSTLQTIAQALRTDLAEFLDEPHDASLSANIDIAHKKEREAKNAASSAGYTYQALVESLKNKYMSPFFVRVKKGATDYFAHDSEEFLLVLRGRLELRYEGRVYPLKEGDSAYFDSRIKHQFRNTGNRDALILSVNFNYRRF